MQVCSSLPPGAGFVSSMTNYLDCQAQILGSAGWQALAMPGSSLATLLIGFLTIFVALIGYRLLLGQSYTIRDGTLAFVKIGAVFALATSWPAYRTLVYDLVIDGPSQLVAEIGPPAAISGSDGSLLQRLDGADLALSQLAILGTGNSIAYQRDVPPPPFGGFDAFALGGSRILYLLTAVAGLAAVRVIAGLALALGPFFIAFLLFDNTRSLFEGWVRVLGAAALAAIGAAVALGLELSVLEPWLSSALARRAAGEALPTISVELFVIVTLFTIIVIAMLFASARLAKGFRLAPILGMRVKDPSASLATAAGEQARRAPSSVVGIERSRATAMAQLLVTTSRRGEFAGAMSPGSGPSAGTAIGSAAASPLEPRTMPVGRSFRRRPGSRISARAAHRDAGR